MVDSQNEWRHFHVNSRDTPIFRIAIENFLNTENPYPHNIQGSISSGADFHLFIKPGDSSTAHHRYRLDHLNGSSIGPGWINQLISRLNTEKITIIGFNEDEPPSLWYVVAY